MTPAADPRRRDPDRDDEEPGTPFVAALGVDDLLLVGLLGLEPAGVVLGYSLHAADLGEDALPVLPSDGEAAGATDGEHGVPVPGEVFARSTAVESAWALALARLLAQADDLDAVGVLGIDLTVATDPDGRRLAITAHGTAVRRAEPGGGTGPRGGVRRGRRRVVALHVDGVPPAPDPGRIAVVAWGTAVRRVEADGRAVPEPAVVLPLLGGRP